MPCICGKCPSADVCPFVIASYEQMREEDPDMLPWGVGDSDDEDGSLDFKIVPHTRPEPSFPSGLIEHAQLLHRDASRILEENTSRNTIFVGIRLYRELALSAQALAAKAMQSEQSSTPLKVMLANMEKMQKQCNDAIQEVKKDLKPIVKDQRKNNATNGSTTASGIIMDTTSHTVLVNSFPIQLYDSLGSLKVSTMKHDNPGVDILAAEWRRVPKRRGQKNSMLVVTVRTGPMATKLLRDGLRVGTQTFLETLPSS